jgi:hypothetical protein
MKLEWLHIFTAALIVLGVFGAYLSLRLYRDTHH